MHVAFRVDAGVDRADHIAFLEACATHGQGIVAIRDGAGRTQPCDPKAELETLRRRTRRAIPVCYLVPADLGTRLSDRFRQAIPVQETRPGYATVLDPLIDFIAPRHRAILDDRALGSAEIAVPVQARLRNAGYDTLGSLAQTSRKLLTDEVALDAGEIDHLAAAIAVEVDRLANERPGEGYPGILRADTLTRPILASVPTTSLNIDETAFDALYRADLTDLALVAACPAPRLMRILKNDPAHLRQVVHVLIAATHAALERWSAPYSLTETPMGLDHGPRTLRALRHISLAQTAIPKALRQRLAKLGYDTLADVVQTPIEIWHGVYGLDMGAIADLQTAAILAETRLHHRPFPGDGRPGSLPSFLERHLLADLTGQAPVPDAVARDNPGTLGFDVYAVTPVFAETLALLFEPVGQFAGRPVWYRLDTGPLDADPNLITLAKLCAATLALHDAPDHDLAALPKGTAH